MLSLAEQNAVKTLEYILTKNSILQKVAIFFGDLSEEYLHIHNILHTPKFALQLNPKISKGENYLGFPYLMLDFPRVFEKEHVFAIRSFFWWGHYFSITLHVKGRHKPLINLKSIAESESKWSYYIGKDEWENNMNEDNLITICPAQLDFLENKFQENSFSKIVQIFDLEDWNNTKQLYMHSYRNILQLIDSSHLYGE